MAAAKKTKLQYVWYIAKFKERYEYRDDKSKQGSLEYTRAYVSVSRDVESRPFMDELEELKEDGLWLMAEGAFNELRRRAANDVRAYRGYLLHQRNPAGIERIALWLKTSTAKSEEILSVLAEVGWLKKVPFPDFSEKSEKSENPSPKRKESKTASGNRKTSKEKKPAKPEKKKTKTKAANAAPEAEAETEKETEAATAAPETKPESAEAKAKANGNNNHETPGASRTQSTAAPILPTLSESGGSDDAKYPKATHSPRSIKSILECSTNEQIETLYDPRAKEFACTIFRNMRPPYQPDSVRGRRELGNYAAAWSGALAAGINPATLVDLWDKSVIDAKKLGNKRDRVKWTKGPEAVWRDNFNQRLAARKTGNVSVSAGFS